MILVAIVDALLKSGASAEMIAAAVKAAEVDREAIDDARREKARLKKQTQREKSIHNKINDCVPVTEGDNRGQSGTIGDGEKASTARAHIHASAPVSPVGISNEIPLIRTPLPTEGPQIKKSPSEEPKRKNGTCLPENWVPSEELFAYGGQHGLTREQTATVFEDMRIWAGANRNRAVARKADWNLTAKGFIRRDAIKFKARAGPRQAQPDAYAASLLDTLREIENDRIAALNPIACNGVRVVEKCRQVEIGSMPYCIEIDADDDAASG